MFGPKSGVRERILLFGGAGSGKTHAWLSVAKYLQDHGNPAKFHIIDTDDGVERLLEGEFPDLNNLTVHHVYSWPSYERAQKAVLDAAKQGDWVIVDLVDNAWEAVQGFYIEQVYGKDMAQWYLELRQDANNTKDVSKKIADEGIWNIIKKLYNGFWMPLVLETPANLLACAKAARVYDKDTAEIQSMFPTKTKPAGEKNLPYQFHTVILMQSIAKGKAHEYRATTFKDRSRDIMDAMLVKSFPVQYLAAKAGWKDS